MSLLAACIFFTRLPFWRIKDVPKEYFKTVVNYWPLVGWLTGSITAGILWLGAQILPFPVAVILAVTGRLLLTGALHEDGLADFFDGFGGGITKERTLAIMKDSGIGSYGVIGLVCYFLLLCGILSHLPVQAATCALMAGDAWAKFVASQLVNTLPYARNEEDSKIKTVYKRMTMQTFLLAFFCGGLPLALLLPPLLWTAALLPMLVFFLLFRLMKRCLQGYTGDCCGATFLLCELSFYLGVLLLIPYL